MDGDSASIEIDTTAGAERLGEARTATMAADGDWHDGDGRLEAHGVDSHTVGIAGVGATSVRLQQAPKSTNGTDRSR